MACGRAVSAAVRHAELAGSIADRTCPAGLQTAPARADTQPVGFASTASPAASRIPSFARALLTAARAWSLYPAEHPAVGQAVGRLSAAFADLAEAAPLTIGVSPDTLLISGTPIDQPAPAVAEAAALLHDRDILALTITAAAPDAALPALLRLIALDEATRRAQGGPAQVWAATGHPSITLQQIDYQRVLDGDPARAASKRDDVWHAIVQSLSTGRSGFSATEQARLAVIAQDAGAVVAVAGAVMASKCAADGSPMIVAQAAAVLATFRRLAESVAMAAPDQRPEALRQFAAAATGLDPHVVMELFGDRGRAGDDGDLVGELAAAFDDAKVAQIVATTLALDGRVSDRLAAVFNTIAPDADRRARILTLARARLGDTPTGQAAEFETLWTSMEQLLVSYDDRPFVSDQYRATLDGMGARAERMAAADLPAELDAWMATIGQAPVRALSVQLLIDLLAIERDSPRAAEIVSDIGALAEDLLWSGAYADLGPVTRTLQEGAADGDDALRAACRQALDQLGAAPAMRDATALLGDLDDRDWAHVKSVFEAVGPAAVAALCGAVVVEHETRTSQRAAEAIAGFGPAAAPHLNALVTDPRWMARLAAVRLLNRIGSAEVIAPLERLTADADPRVSCEAVAALGCIDHPSAVRAIHHVLRTAQGETRRAVIDALVAGRDARVVPLLTRVIEASDAIGRDHPVVLEAIGALGEVGSDRAVPVLASTIARRGWFRRRRLRALKARGVDALVRIGGAKAIAALDRASQHGDGLLRTVVAERRGGTR